MTFLAGWQSENKPSVIIFDQPSVASLLYKVSSIYVLMQQYAHTGDKLVELYKKKTFLTDLPYITQVVNILASLNLTVHPTFQLTAFSFRDFVRFGYVDQADKQSTQLLKQFNVNTYAPTMMLFKEDTEKPVDIIQVEAAPKQ